MNLPRQFHYGPRRTGNATLMVICSVVAALMAVRTLRCGPSNDFIGLVPLSTTGAAIYYWVRVALNALWCTVFAGLALVCLANFIRRLTHPRTLELAADALLLPYGFLQKHTRRIAYAEIRQVREQIFGRLCTLQITTAERTSEISTILLPNSGDYGAIREFMLAHAPATAPTPARLKPASLLSREEFMSRQADAEHQIRRHVIPFGINYAIIVVMIPAMIGLILFLGVLPFTNYPPDIRAGLQVRDLWLLVFCAVFYGGALLAIWDGTRKFKRYSFKCPGCEKNLVFAAGKASLKTGDCVHCGQQVFY